MRCYICNCEITSSNKSSEHIFPNCIGGRLKPSNLMCRNCNSSFGADIDRAICEQLKTWSNLLNIKRDRGDPPTINRRFEDTGTEIVWPAGRSPQVRFQVKSVRIKDGLLLEFNGNWETVQNYIGRLQQKYDNVKVGPIKDIITMA